MPFVGAAGAAAPAGAGAALRYLCVVCSVTVGVVEACMGCLVIDFVIAAAYFVIAAHTS